MNEKQHQELVETAMVRTGPHSIVATAKPAERAERAEQRSEPWDGIRIPCAVVNRVPVFPICSDTIREIAPAFARAQSAFVAAKRDTKNPGFKREDGSAVYYADLASVHEACVAALNAEGMGVNHFTFTLGDEVFLLTRVTHASGEWYQSSFPLSTLDSVRQSIADQQSKPAVATGGGLDATPAGEPAKKKRLPGVHTIGSEITFLRRYCLAALLGVVTEEDDDGNEAQRYQASRQASAPQARRAPTGGGL